MEWSISNIENVSQTLLWISTLTTGYLYSNLKSIKFKDIENTLIKYGENVHIGTIFKIGLIVQEMVVFICGFLFFFFSYTQFTNTVNIFK